jgi:hypothetical protein
MGLELPLVSAIMARLANPEISLAAYGSVVFPLSMIVEAPIIMLLSASTALSRDGSSYLLLRGFMLRAGAILTLIHALIAFTPLYDLVVGGVIHPPPEVLGPARLGLMIMTPWTWSIAYRRFHQGILIRHGHTHAVGMGTVIRLSTNIVILALGYAKGDLPGIVVGSAAVACGVVGEALFIGLAARSIVRDKVLTAPPPATPLTYRAFFDFYVPLGLTSLIGLAGMPMISAALGRMPRALESMAVWPVIQGLTFTLRSTGFAFTEVVVALLDREGAVRNLKRFARLLGLVTSSLLLLIALTPLARGYFSRLSALSPDLTELASRGVLLVVLLPGLAAIQCWYQGVLVHTRRTRAITESITIFLGSTTLVLLLGLAFGRATGLYVGLAAFVAGTICQVGWLWHRSREGLRALGVATPRI